MHEAMNCDRRIIIITCLFLVLLGSPFFLSTAFASSPEQQQPQTRGELRLSLQGAVLDGGVQNYSTVGGAFVSGTVLGHSISEAVLDYSYQALASGFSVKGASFLTIHGQTKSDESFTVKSEGNIVAMIPAVYLPYGCMPGVDCTSEIPALFVSASKIAITLGNTKESYMVPILFESAYLHPWGGPIFIASNDSAIVLVAKYESGTIQWSNVLMGGILSGSFGSSKVSGEFAMAVNSSEDLLKGVEYDLGAIALFNMNPSKLDSVGYLAGISVIPKAGETRCVGWIGPKGTCVNTGLNSTGLLVLSGEAGRFLGGYHTIWTIPAIGFTSVVIAYRQG